MGKIDIYIFVFYFVVLIFIGFWSGRKKKDTAEDFFLATGKLKWYVIGFAFIAAGISSEQFIGTVGFAYSNGISVANWEWLNGPSLLVLLIVFVPFYLRKKVVTMPQFLEMRFDGKVRTLFALLTILTYIFINLAGVIYSGGYALNIIFGINLYLALWSVTILAGLFTIWGGMASVAWTNVFQSVLLLGGGLLVFILGLFEVDGGLKEIIGTGERSHLILPANHPEIPWTGLIVLALSTNIWYYCTNQTINQAVLGAKDEWHARMGVIFAGFLWVFIAFADVFPGLIAKALAPDIAPDSAYPYVVNSLVPAGFKGIVFAGLCGAIISTIEAVINASSSIFTFDIYKRYINKNAGNKELIRAGRITSGFVLIIGAAWAPTVLSFGHIFSYFQETWTYVAIPVTVIFVGGILWKRLNSKVAFIILLLTFPMFIVPYLLRMLKVEMNVFNVAGFVLIFFIILTYVLGIIFIKKEAYASNEFQWNLRMSALPEKIRQHYGKWFQSLILWGSLMVAIYILIYSIFW